MVRVVGVRFKKAGKVYYFDPAEFPVAAGARVVVETARGVEYGEVAVGPKDVEEEQVVQPLKKVLRIGNEKDAIVAAENKRKENEAFGIAQKKIEGHSLDMNLVDVEYTFDGSKIIFYFTAEGRIDFRELVRDLAGVFRTRIEMRQIGVRDEAKLLGGIGPCGRILCCTSFLGDFAPVSIRMAKDQNLSLNPSKISGLCGRLMCCLRYEQETYEAAKKDPTLAPGYVPPALLEEAVPELTELEDRPAPAIGVRRDRDSSGLGARIAQAVGVAERPAKREERPPIERRERPERAERPERPERTERPQGQPPRERTERPERSRPEGQAQAQRPPRPERQQGQGQRPPRPEGQQPRERQQGQGQRPPRPEGQRQDKPQGGQGQQQPRERQQGQGQRPPRPEGQQPRERQQGQGQRPPRTEGQPQRERQPRPPQAEGQAPQPGAGEEQAHRHRHRGHRRRGGSGAGGPGGPGPQGGGNSQE